MFYQCFNYRNDYWNGKMEIRKKKNIKKFDPPGPWPCINTVEWPVFNIIYHICNMQGEVYFSFVDVSQVTSVGRCGPISIRDHPGRPLRFGLSLVSEARDWPLVGWLCPLWLAAGRSPGLARWPQYWPGPEVSLPASDSCPRLLALFPTISRAPVLSDNTAYAETETVTQVTTALPSPETKWQHEGVNNTGFEELENKVSKSAWHFFFKRSHLRC